MVTKYQEYCEILGVKPGAGPEEVKRAFRARIKIYHPDRASTNDQAETARRIIEAYQALKNGVREITEKKTEYTKQTQPARTHSSERHVFLKGRDLGRRLYNQVFQDRKSEPESDLWDRLSNFIYSDEEETAIYGENINVREFVFSQNKKKKNNGQNKGREPFLRSPSKTKKNKQRAEPKGEAKNEATHEKPANSTVNDVAHEYFNRAESVLKEIVFRYDKKSNHRTGQWMRQYIARLNEVQVLYRDIVCRHPSVANSAEKRLRQINELMLEIKRLAR